MPLTFEKRVKRMQKWVLGTIVAVMVVSLIFWGYSPTGPGDEDAGGIAGKLYADDPKLATTVTKREFRDQARRALPYIRYGFFQQYPPKSREMYGISRDAVIEAIAKGGWDRLPRYMRPDESESAVREKTWEMIVLVRLAKASRLLVTDDEIRAEEHALFSATGWPDDDKRENFERFTGVLFGTDVRTFEDMLRDALLIDKSLDIELAGPAVKFRDIYRELVDKSRRARVAVAAIDPDRFAAQPQPVGEEAIAKYYETNKQKYEVPEKVQVEFLMADLEALKARQPEPTDEAIRQYYEDNKTGMFTKPHEHAEGEEHSPQEVPDFKLLEEVREEIRGKIKGRDAGTQARNAILDVNREIGAWYGKKDKELREQVKAELKDKPKEEQARLDQIVRERLNAATANLFGELKQQFQTRGIELTHDISVLFDNRRLEEAWKTMGKIQRAEVEQRFKNWVFREPVGDVCRELAETEKGWCVLRLARKVDKYIPDMTGPVREQILRELRREGVRKLTAKTADDIVQDLNGTKLTPQQRMLFDPSVSLREIAVRHGVNFVESDYFGSAVGAGEDSTLGLGETSLATQVRQKAFPPGGPFDGGGAPLVAEATASRAFVIQGTADKEMWSYVAFVEDMVNVPSERIDDDFRGKRADEEEQKRKAERSKRIESIMKGAAIDDRMEKGKSEK